MHLLGDPLHSLGRQQITMDAAQNDLMRRTDKARALTSRTCHLHSLKPLARLTTAVEQGTADHGRVAYFVSPRPAVETALRRSFRG
jgi:hypothetical protein